jgi:hypothetical protein
MIKTATTTINMLHDLATVPAQGFVGDIVAEFPSYAEGAGDEGPLRMQWDALFTQVQYMSSCMMHGTRYTVHHTLVHDTRYTIHHTPYTVHHPPYTINHKPYTIHHTPYTHTLLHHTLVRSYTITIRSYYGTYCSHSRRITGSSTSHSMEGRRLCAPGRDIGCK